MDDERSIEAVVVVGSVVEKCGWHPQKPGGDRGRSAGTGTGAVGQGLAACSLLIPLCLSACSQVVVSNGNLVMVIYLFLNNYESIESDVWSMLATPMGSRSHLQQLIHAYRIQTSCTQLF